VAQFFRAAAITPSPRSNPLLLRTALACLGKSTVGKIRPASVGRLSLALGLVGGCSKLTGEGGGIVWRTCWRGPGPPAPSGGFWRCPRSNPRNCSGGPAVVAAAGVETGRGGCLGHRHPLCALVARVVSDPARCLPNRPSRPCAAAGAPAGRRLLTALGPALACRGAFSYGGYRLEMRSCAGATPAAGWFGLVWALARNWRPEALQSLQFHELWTGLWLLLAVMLSLEAPAAGPAGHAGAMPSRFQADRRWRGPAAAGKLLLALLACCPCWCWCEWPWRISPSQLLAWQPLAATAGQLDGRCWPCPWPPGGHQPLA